jgi:uncharacterized Zn-binding protein involved in type VI secretion
MTKTFRVVLLALLLSTLLPGRAWSAFVVESATVAPSSVSVGVGTPVTLTAVITDPLLIPESVTAQRLDSAGRVLGVYGVLHDDGAFGDLVAGDKTFTLRLTLFEQRPGTVWLRVSAAFRTRILRAFSSTLAVNVTNLVIVSPANLALVNTSPVNVTGTIADPAAAVSVNGVPAIVSGGGFQASVVLVEGANTITALAQHSNGTTSTATVQVTLDTSPPELTIDSPADGFMTLESSITVSGTVSDLQAQVSVNGVPTQVINGTFLASNVPLVVGPNTIQVSASDPAGNSSTAQITVTRGS